MVGSKSHMERKEFTLSCIALARALVIGPLGVLVVVGGVKSVGWAVSGGHWFVGLRRSKIVYLSLPPKPSM